MKLAIPRRFAPLIYGILQAAITSAVATTVATVQGSASISNAVAYWLSSWSLSWLAMMPIVILVSPVLQRAVLALTTPGE